MEACKMKTNQEHYPDWKTCSKIRVVDEEEA
jgi:hypothetical protein